MHSPGDAPTEGAQGRQRRLWLLAPRIALAAAVAGAALGLPLYLPVYKVDVVTTAFAFCIAALSLNVLIGMTGQISVAQAAFLGVGAVLATHLGHEHLAWPLVLLAAMAGTAVVTTIVGIPSLRISGMQVAVATLAFQLFAVAAAESTTILTNTYSFKRPALLAGSTPLYYFGLVLLALVATILARIRATKAGRAFAAVRENERRAPTLGISVGSNKLLAYALSGALVGLGGALYALQLGSLGSDSGFTLQDSLILIAIVVVGGTGSSFGIVLMALVVYALPGLVPSVARWVDIAIPAATVAAIVYQPRGVGGLLAKLDARLRRRWAAPEEDRRLAFGLAGAVAGAEDLRAVPMGMGRWMPARTMLGVEGATVRYGGVTALDHLDMEVRRGEIVGLIGANGAGKSTFFHAVSGLVPVSGSIRFRGTELTTLPPDRRSAAGISRTFQEMGLVRAETVRTNVLLAQHWLARYPAPAGLLGLGGAPGTEKDLARRVDASLSIFGLADLSGERLGDLPYGIQRLVEIASAVAAGPDLLLLDEASAGLAPGESSRLGGIFEDLRSELGLTLLVIEHYVPLIANVCDFVYCLESGTLIAAGSPAEVTAQPAVVRSFLGTAPTEVELSRGTSDGDQAFQGGQRRRRRFPDTAHTEAAR